MDKVIITQKQANDIKRITSFFHKSDLLARQAKGDPWDHYESLNNLSLDDMARALYVGYEAEPEFREGDWVIEPVNKKVGFVERISNYNLIMDYGSWHLPKNVRHATDEEIATEKQRRFWNGNDRYVWELRKGDVLRYNKKDQPLDVVSSVEGNVVHFINGERDYLNIMFFGRYEVVCFAEKRKDIN